MWKCELCEDWYDEVSFLKDERFGGTGKEITVCDNCLDKADEIDPIQLVNKEDLEMERNFLIQHLKDLISTWKNSREQTFRLSAQHFETIVYELESGILLKNAKILAEIKDKK